MDELKQKFKDAGIKVSESEFVAAGMAGAHSQYAGVIAAEQRMHQLNNQPFTVEKLIAVMTLQYKSLDTKN